MDKLRSAILGIACIMATSISAAQDSAAQAGVLMDCTYTSHDSASTTLLASSDATRWPGDRPSSRKVGGDQPSRASMSLAPGEFAECIYVNGHSVRVKVGAGVARPVGMCAGDPPIFLTLWVDKRKVDSYVTFAGPCTEGRLLSYSIDQHGVQRCWKESKDNAAEESNPHACERLSASDTLQLDKIEYPTSPQPEVGDIEIRSGEHEVCRAIQAEATSRWDAFFGSEIPLSLDQPTFRNSSAPLPKGLAGSRASEFDFDNDGVPDRVFLKEHTYNYMWGSTMLVNPKLDPAANPISGWFLPCQMDERDIPLQQCPPFSQAYDNAALSMPDPASKQVDFSARYSYLVPFRYKGVTYVAISRGALSTEQWIAVLKPLPRHTLERMCLIRKVPANF